MGWLPACTPCSGLPGGSDGKESARNAGDPGSIPGLGQTPGEWNGYPLQYSCLENSMDREAWQASVQGVTESDMTEQLTFSLFIPCSRRSRLFSLPEWSKHVTNSLSLHKTPLSRCSNHSLPQIPSSGPSLSWVFYQPPRPPPNGKWPELPWYSYTSVTVHGSYFPSCAAVIWNLFSCCPSALLSTFYYEMPCWVPGTWK